MPKLEFTPVADWQRFNFLGKRFFDVLNQKLNILTRTYVGTGAELRLFVDLIPKIILIFSEEDRLPVFWMDIFFDIQCKDFLGNTITDAILEVAPKKDSFLLGTNILVNEVGINYYFVVIGN